MAEPDNIVQLPPEALAGAANFASKFQGVNAAQRAKYQGDQVAYAQALQRQQAEHLAQLAMTNKDVAGILQNQQKLAMAQELQKAKLAHMTAQDTAQQLKAYTDFQTKALLAQQEAETNKQTGAFIDAQREAAQKYGLHTPEYYKAIDPANFPALDDSNPAVKGYLQGQRAFTAPSQQVGGAIPPSVLNNYAKLQGVLEYHPVAAQAEAQKNIADKKENVPYTGAADWAMKQKEAAMLEQQYPQLKSMGTPVAPTPVPQQTAPAAPTATPAAEQIIPAGGIVGGPAQPEPYPTPPVPRNIYASPTPASYPPPPKVGDIQMGHQYQGGNPADPASWKPVQ